MIDRVELQRVYAYLLELEERKRRQVQEREERQAVRVELSSRVAGKDTVDYEDLRKKVENIRSLLERNAYEVSPERIVQGLEKFLSSK